MFSTNQKPPRFASSWLGSVEQWGWFELVGELYRAPHHLLVYILKIKEELDTYYDLRRESG